jgi:membrane protease YdiL (CAAX protease family)
MESPHGTRPLISRRLFLFFAEGIRRVRESLQTPNGKNIILAIIYLFLITVAEAVTTEVDPQLGIILHASVLIALMLHGSLVRKGPARRLIIVLSLAPLIRLLSLSLPLAKLGLPVIYWYMIIGAPLFLAAYVASRVTDLHGKRIGWSGQKWPLQILLGLTGFILGYIEYLILRPGPLASYLGLEDIVVASLILVIFTGVLEEVIFRGLMQSASMQLMGKFGLIYVAFLFAILHLGYHSFLDLFFVLIVGLIFGMMVWKTQSLLGASLAHGAANVSLYVFLPFLMMSGPVPISSSITAKPESTAIAAPSLINMGTPNPPELQEPPLEVIVDNDGPGFFFTGVNLWLDAVRGYQGSFRWTYAAQSMPDLVVTWIPALKGCGLYNIEVYIPIAIGATESARYTILHRTGQTQVLVNQASLGGDWVDLGEYELEEGLPYGLQLANLTGDEPRLMRWVGFDAARWTLAGSCTQPEER